MSLRYNGKPNVLANVQHDKPIDLCLCKFVGVGMPMNGRSCDVHGTKGYPCKETGCPDYRPSKPKLSPKHWPRCQCGMIAQDHG